MSLFKAREWSSTWCGNAEEEFDCGSLCVANIDNSSDNLEKVIVGSLNGTIRILIGREGGFKPEDLMLEMQLNHAILQVESGRFASGTTDLQLCLLHPRSVAVYSVSSVTASVEHSNHFVLSQLYEHRLERSSYCITCGPFGGVKDKDFMCVLSIDGILAFFEQESFSIQVYLPNFLLPAPMKYVASTDAFLVSTADRRLESFRYHSLASASTEDKNSSKKVHYEWSKSLGDHVISIQVVNSESQEKVMVLGERSLFTMSISGDIEVMKKLEYNPSSFFAYPKKGNVQENSNNPSTIISLVSTHSNSLLVYEGIQLIWAAQLPHVPVACKIGNFEELNGVIVTVNEYGHLYCSYLGTDPSLFMAPNVEARAGNFQELDKELKRLNKFIKESNNGAGKVARTQRNEALAVKIDVPSKLDEIPVTLECKTIRPIESIVLTFSQKYPIVCSQPTINIPILGNKGPTVSYEVSFAILGSSVASDLEVVAAASYTNESDAPRIVQTFFTLPLNLICRGSQPVKQATHKLTIGTNKEPVNLAELFPELVNDAVIPVPVLGIQYIEGPTVTILSSKQSNRYRVQCDSFDALYLIVYELIRRLEEYFGKKKDGTTFKASFQGPLPLNEYYEYIDNHFNQRLSLENLKEMLDQRAQQFRVIQKRLLTRFKDKTPSPLAHLDTLLDGTYKQLLALGEEFENAQSALRHCGYSLSCVTRLVTLLIRLMVSMNDNNFKILTSSLTPVIIESTEHGWEEIVNSNISYLLRTCLAKSVKEQNTALPTLKMEKDTSKLKRNIALLCERLNKGASLSTNQSQRKESRQSLTVADKTLADTPRILSLFARPIQQVMNMRQTTQEWTK